MRKYAGYSSNNVYIKKKHADLIADIFEDMSSRKPVVQDDDEPPTLEPIKPLVPQVTRIVYYRI